MVGGRLSEARVAELSCLLLDRSAWLKRPSGMGEIAQPRWSGCRSGLDSSQSVTLAGSPPSALQAPMDFNSDPHQAPGSWPRDQMNRGSKRQVWSKATARWNMAAGHEVHRQLPLPAEAGRRNPPNLSWPILFSPART